MTLIELLTTMAILGFVMSGIIAVFVSGLHAEVDMNKRFQAQQEARLALQSMRTDVRTACSEAVTGDTAQLGFCSDATHTWSSSPVTSVTWCTRNEGGGYYGLFRETEPGSPTGDPNCVSGTAGVREADSLTTGSVFSMPPVSTGQRPELAVNFPVDADLSRSGGLYTLSDTIMLRNAPVSP